MDFFHLAKINIRTERISSRRPHPLVESHILEKAQECGNQPTVFRLKKQVNR